MSARPAPVISPRRAVGTGLLAGFAGTALMTAVQVAVKGLSGSRGFEEDENLPAEVGERLIRGLLHRDPPDDRARLGAAVHWGYGSALGIGLGVATADRSPDVLRSGLAFGAAVWGLSLVEMPTMRLAPPIWRLGPREIVPDLAFHLVYGVAAAGALRAALPRAVREPEPDDEPVRAA